jgi:hypothetical protein
MNTDSVLASILTARMTKFQKLDAIMPDLSSHQMVNIFVDLRSIIGKLYTEELSNAVANINAQNRLLICVSVANIIGHYRLWFWSRFNVYTNFFVYYSDKMPRSQGAICPEYRSSNCRRHALDGEFPLVASLVNGNLDVFKELCRTLPYVSCIDSGTVDPNATPAVVLSLRPKLAPFPNIILSNREEPLVYMHDNNFSVMTMRGDDKTDIYGPLCGEDWSPAAVRYLCEGSKTVTGEEISPKMIPLVLAMSGVKRLDLNGLQRVGPALALKRVKKLIDSGAISGDVALGSGPIKKILIENGYTEDDALIISRNTAVLSPNKAVRDMSETELDFIRGQARFGVAARREVHEANHGIFKANRIKTNGLFCSEEQENEEDQ